jgi:AraC family transcriptional regulator, melibiose operon regulatory protein
VSLYQLVDDRGYPIRGRFVQKVSRMARCVAENHARPLRVQDVAQHVGLHPNYAMTLNTCSASARRRTS